MSAPAGGSAEAPNEARQVDGDTQYNEVNHNQNTSRGLPAYHYDPLTPREQARRADAAAAAQDRLNNTPPTVQQTIPSPLDILAIAATEAAHQDDEEEQQIGVPQTPERSYLDVHQPSPTRGNLFRTPRVPSIVGPGVVGVHETPGAIFGAISRSNTPAIPEGEAEADGDVEMGGVEDLSRGAGTQEPGYQHPTSFVRGAGGDVQQPTSLPERQRANIQRTSLLNQSMILGATTQSANTAQTVNLAAARLSMYLNPGVVAGATPTFATGQAAETSQQTGGNDAALGVPGDRPARAFGGQSAAGVGGAEALLALRGRHSVTTGPSGVAQAFGGNNTASAGPSGASFRPIGAGLPMPAKPPTPPAPIPSPITPIFGPTVNIIPAPLPSGDAINANDPNGTLARRMQAYDSFADAADYLDQNIRPADEKLIAPPIHNNYVIKTVATVKCDECGVKLASGGELYQCKTCGGQICQDCVNGQLLKEQTLKSLDFERRQARVDAVGGHHIDLEPDESDDDDPILTVQEDAESDNSMKISDMRNDRKPSMQPTFEWRGQHCHVPFKLCYLARRKFQGMDRGPFQTDVAVADYDGIVSRVIVQLIKDSPRKSGGTGDGDSVVAGSSGKGKGKARADADEVPDDDGEDHVDDDTPTARPKSKKKAKAKRKGKGKEREAKGTEDEPVAVDDVWDEESAQAQVQSAVLGGRPAFDKLRRMQEAARLGRTPAARGVRGIGRGRGFGPALPTRTWAESRPVGGRAGSLSPQHQQFAQQHGFTLQFDQQPRSQTYVPTVHGHPTRASEWAFNPTQPQQREHPQQLEAARRFLVPSPDYQPHTTPAPSYPSQPLGPFNGRNSTGLNQQNMFFGARANTPTVNTARQFPTPLQSVRHVRENQQYLRAASTPLQATFTNPQDQQNLHPDQSGLPSFHQGNTFFAQAYLQDGTPITVSLPQQPFHFDPSSVVMDPNFDFYAPTYSREEAAIAHEQARLHHEARQEQEAQASQLAQKQAQQNQQNQPAQQGQQAQAPAPAAPVTTAPTPLPPPTAYPPGFMQSFIPPTQASHAPRVPQQPFSPITTTVAGYRPHYIQQYRMPVPASPYTNGGIPNMMFNPWAGGLLTPPPPQHLAGGQTAANAIAVESDEEEEKEAEEEEEDEEDEDDEKKSPPATTATTALARRGGRASDVAGVNPSRRAAPISAVGGRRGRSAPPAFRSAAAARRAALLREEEELGVGSEGVGEEEVVEEEDDDEEVEVEEEVEEEVVGGGGLGLVPARGHTRSGREFQ